VRGGEVGGRDAGERSLRPGQVRGALAVQEGQKGQAAGAGRCRLERRIQLRHAAAGQPQRPGHHVGCVHGADQRQPSARGGAEGRHRAAPVRGRPVAVGEDGGRGAEAQGDDTLADVARPDGRHHVVPAAGGHRAAGGQAEPRRRLRAQPSRHLLRAGEGGQRGPEPPRAAVDRIQNLALPGAAAGIEEAGPGGVPRLRPEPPGEPEVQVVVGQQDVADAGKVLRLALAQPLQLGDGVAGQGHDAEAAQPLRRAAEARDQRGVLPGRLGVVPQLGRADDLERLVEDHQPVLLGGDGHPGDLHRRGGGHRLAHGLLERRHPPLRPLLAGAVLALDERVGSVAAAQPPPVGVDQQRLGSLGAAVDSEVGRGPHAARRPGRGHRPRWGRGVGTGSLRVILPSMLHRRAARQDAPALIRRGEPARRPPGHRNPGTGTRHATPCKPRATGPGRRGGGSPGAPTERAS